MEKFNNLFLETIYKDKLNNNILTITSLNKNKKFEYQFNLNKIDKLPYLYKNVAVFASAKNNDLFHLINRKNNRASNYTIDNIIFIVNNALDYFLKNKNKINFKFNQSFLVTSKSFSDIKLSIQITENNIELVDKINLDQIYGNLFYSQYFCFIYTILLNNMVSNNKFDKEIVVENLIEVE